MSALALEPCPTVDLIFPISGRFLPRDHAQALKDALCRAWPWLEVEPLAGVQCIKLVPGLEPQAMLSGRAKLLLRLSRERATELINATAIDLEVADQALHLGVPHVRELVPHTTLYAFHVAATDADEVAFMASVTQALSGLGVGGERVCGKRQQLTLASGVVPTFSLMLHGLAPEPSLHLQRHGIGPHRLLGCGIFIPHKSAAAV
ncbi:type I-MYXAN CRISPR-associated protein Cas6/Cmx6 [Rhodoferax sp.]|uniref:type I-MYXAN CRISPR-associated protein Cas6/Cmx6 n=2 Tax=Rhodoferax sp. TaxID=50421 RepID=UPI00272F097B|nr:type I-MYXAN CRISPR-associated protein Cas6/Cmx6 [Rhodoferax sp.]MDP1530012.1 type I-MYXAN CRISPR-associated protein Cas6/Cmx6 [Rhodoferax sp.]MDP1945752.1 type I-MYXAN CRISPR-associated protein Cas6/Cmx6 [Rhodoferax sp.]MDP2442249.1 type I-MYXAN CRISPR-associated protein Cas6/Cmx6 [Rhodoferax sp.]MDZ4206892.1 type I-MYXAN CRISPR-associated protein Cas6/Cmx6 [Rhodoferax sp.]